MPTTLTAAAALALDVDFQNRVTAALMFVARELIVDTSAPEFSRALARDVARNPVNYTDGVAWVLSADSTLPNTGVTDAQIVTALRAAWPALSRL